MGWVCSSALALQWTVDVPVWTRPDLVALGNKVGTSPIRAQRSAGSLRAGRMSSGLTGSPSAYPIPRPAIAATPHAIAVPRTSRLAMPATLATQRSSLTNQRSPTRDPAPLTSPARARFRANPGGTELPATPASGAGVLRRWRAPDRPANPRFPSTDAIAHTLSSTRFPPPPTPARCLSQPRIPTPPDRSTARPNPAKPPIGTHPPSPCIVTQRCPALVAQRIEHLTTDQKVGGSNPSERASKPQVTRWMTWGFALSATVLANASADTAPTLTCLARRLRRPGPR